MRHPQREYSPKIINGAISPAPDKPLSNSAVASPRSRFGNHSETALVAAGQLADSPKPSRKRNPAKLFQPVASAVSTETTEYQTTEIVSPRRVPIRSRHFPLSVWP